MKLKLIIILLLSFISCNNSNDYLLLQTNKQDQYGYIDQKNDTVIPFGKYPMCFTDTFKKFAIVLNPEVGFVAIDRKENVLFKVFPFDNGPDYIVEGLFRIVKNGKIGYADSNFSVKIQPQYGCAFPFENGVAKVSTNCKTVAVDKDGEHSVWLSNTWFYINKQGDRVKN